MNIKNRFIQKLIDYQLDAFLITKPKNKKYLTGIDSDFTYVFFTIKKVYFLVPEIIYEYTKRKIDLKTIRLVKYKNNPFSIIRNVIIKQKIKKVAFEEDYLPYNKWQYFNGIAPKLIPIKGFIEEIRSIKTLKEIEVLSEAVRITELAIENTLKKPQKNMTELDFEKELVKEMYILGAEGIPFRFEISCGSKSAIINSPPENRALKVGELLLIDVGIEYKNYKTDIARTFAISKSTPEQNYLYNLVYLLLMDIQKLLKPGVPVKKISNFASEYLRNAGLRYGLPYDIGHGIGVEVHEKPFLSQKSDEILQEDMVLCIEPGIYLEGFGGIRLEEVILITKKGAELLSNCRERLPIINF
jgi:Xaa-Pro aminopeptidase